MKDFIRIGGPIVSSPLNENFRILANAVSLANTNLIFSKEHGVVNTVQDMQNIHLPEDGQACYVVSNGQMYRYSKAGNGQWVCIADFGQTFRQGFLNSGVALMTGVMITNDETSVLIPATLMYFKNKPGDGSSILGLYAVPPTYLALPSDLSAGTYSIYGYIDNHDEAQYTYRGGLPILDNTNEVYMGSFIVNANHKVMSDFIFTIPNMAYTADRGSFYIDGGRTDGCNLRGRSSGNKVNRDAGYYYFEGINCPFGAWWGENNYIDYIQNTADYNVKYFENVNTPELYYAAPVAGALGSSLSTKVTGLKYDKYYDRNTNTLQNVGIGQFTIQQHFVTPNGQDIVLFGTEVYNSMDDALAHLNDTFSSDLDFPHVEATRIVLGNFNNYRTDDPDMVQFFTMGRIAQVGTISPQFADNEFEIYSGLTSDVTPAAMRISLHELDNEEYNPSVNGIYKAALLPYNWTRKLFGLDRKYIKDGDTPSVTQTLSTVRTYDNGGGYLLASQGDIDDLTTRIENIEKEIWKVNASGTSLWNKSVRERLYSTEEAIADINVDLSHKIENINISRINGNSGNPGSITNLGNVTGLTFYNDGTNISVNNGVATIECVGQWNPDLFLMKSQYASASVSDPSTYAGFVDKAVTAQKITAIDTATANQYYGTDADGFKGMHDLPIYVSTDNAQSYVNVDDVVFQPIDNSVTLKHLANGRVTYLPSSEETQLGTNVYDLVKNHYHKVYNSGTQGPYISGTTTQDTSAITYEYEVPYGGLVAHDYYFTYENTSYVFTLLNDVAASIRFVFTPSLNTLYYTDGITDTSVVIVEIPGPDVDIDYLLSFTTKTDWNKINEWNFGNNLTVSVVDGRATINASVAGNGATNFANLDDTEVTYTDANIGKMIVLGKDGSNNYKLMFGDATSLSGYMLISDYADTTSVQKKVKYATRADTATNALVADTATSATNASHALTADSATTATNATTANSALTADTATNATNALNAQEATYALDAGTAATANLLQNTYSVNDNETSYTVLWSASQIVDYVDNHIPAGGVHTYCGTSIPSSSLGNDGDIYIMIDSGGNVELTPEEIININDSLGGNYNIISDMTEEEATNKVNDIVFDGGQASM